MPQVCQKFVIRVTGFDKFTSLDQPGTRLENIEGEATKQHVARQRDVPL